MVKLYFCKNLTPIGDNDKFYGMSLELCHLFGRESFNSSIRFYAELFHRIKENELRQCELRNSQAKSADSNAPSLPRINASIFFKMHTPGVETIQADILVNNSRFAAAINTPRTFRCSIRLMDRLLRELLESEAYAPLVEVLAVRLSVGDQEAETILKGFLKIFCRSRGLLVNDEDLARAKEQQKQRRRQEYAAFHSSDSDA